jgi:hypothetical protein
MSDVKGDEVLTSTAAALKNIKLKPSATVQAFLGNQLGGTDPAAGEKVLMESGEATYGAISSSETSESEGGKASKRRQIVVPIYDVGRSMLLSDEPIMAINMNFLDNVTVCLERDEVLAYQLLGPYLENPEVYDQHVDPDISGTDLGFNVATFEVYIRQHLDQVNQTVSRALKAAAASSSSCSSSASVSRTERLSPPLCSPCVPLAVVTLTRLALSGVSVR